MLQDLLRILDAAGPSTSRREHARAGLELGSAQRHTPQAHDRPSNALRCECGGRADAVAADHWRAAVLLVRAHRVQRLIQLARLIAIRWTSATVCARRAAAAAARQASRLEPVRAWWTVATLCAATLR